MTKTKVNLKKLQYQQDSDPTEDEGIEEFVNPFVKSRTAKQTDDSADIIERQRRDIKKLTNKLNSAIISIKNLEKRINSIEREKQNGAKW